MSLLFSALIASFLSGQSQMNDEAGESKGRIYSISKNEEKKNTIEKLLFICGPFELVVLFFQMPSSIAADTTTMVGNPF